MAADSWEELDRHCQRLVGEQDTPAIALAVSDRDQTRLVRTYGLADRATRRPATPATAFELGSVGKSFASIVVLRQHERGALDLHAPIGRYLPWLDLPSADPITLHHLLCHTAGLPEDAGADSDGRADARALAAGGPYRPGGEFGYSNAGYNLIGYLLEDLLGQPYATILRDHILEPLGMAETWAVLDDAARDRMATGYLPAEDGRPPQPAPWTPCALASGCSAATAGDLAIYGRMLLNEGQGPAGPLLAPDSFARLIAPQVPAWGGSYGYGLVSSALDGNRCIGHRGETAGFKAYLLADRDAGRAAAVLVSGAAEPIELGEWLLRAARTL